MRTYNMFACVDHGDKSLSGAVRVGASATGNDAPGFEITTESRAREFFNFRHYDEDEGCDSHGKSILRLYDVPEPIAELLETVGATDGSRLYVNEHIIGCYAAWQIASAYTEQRAGMRPSEIVLAARGVVERWDSGDLAGAVRQLAAALEVEDGA